MMIENKDLKILVKAAHAGGKVLKKYFGQVLNLKEKSTLAEFKNEDDIESEEAILKIIKKELSPYNIQSEEEGKIHNGSYYTVVIDPMDGTNNFVTGIPNFTVSIGLLHKGQAVLGVIYQPILDQTFTAEKDKGAYLNGKKITVNDVKDSKRSTVTYICGYKTDRVYLGSVMNSLLVGGHKRILYNWSGAYDYCLLALGKVESVITDGIELHDYAAGKLIAAEAGGKIIDFGGKKEIDYTNDKFIISNTDQVNQYILNIIKPLQTLTK